MEKMLFVFDLHGTLYSDEYVIMPKTKEAIKTLHNRGHIIAIASGHHYSKVEYLIKELGIKFIAMGNTGALIKDFTTNKVYQYGKIDNRILENMFNLFQEYPSILHIHNKDEHKVVVNKLTQKEIAELPIPIEKGDYCNLEYAKKMADKSITQISIKTKQKYIDEIYKKAELFNNLDEVHRLDNIMDLFVDFGPSNTNKWTGVLKTAKELNISENNIYCFGDNRNDFTMLENCVNSVAMGNALDEVKNVCKFQTDSNNNEGIFKFLKKEVL